MTQSNTVNIAKGAAYLSLSAFLFALMGVFIRFASHHDGGVNNYNVVFFRNLTGCLIFVPVLLQQGFTPFKTTILRMHLVRGSVGLAAMYCFFFAIAHLPLAIAMLFTYSAPVFAPAIASLWLGEKMKPAMYLPIAIGFSGVLFILKPTAQIFDSAALVGLASSFLAAIAFVSVRKLSFSEPPLRIVFYFTVSSTVISGVVLLIFGAIQPITLEQLGLLVVVGLTATTSQLCLTKAYQQAPVGKIGHFAYLAVVFSGLFAWVLWAELPSLTAFLGAGLVFSAGFLTLQQARQKANEID